MGRRKRKDAPTGFEEWGGYMAMKKAKLQKQFTEEASKTANRKSSLFNKISIFVNGYTDPPADELRQLMMEHGGIYHHYYKPGNTTYVIASNLPDSKLKQTQGIIFLKPSWVTDCIRENKIINYRDYLLYTNQTRSQPGLKFFTEVNEKSSLDMKQNIAKTATDKQFLSEFYNNSRLHHISSMGAVFKQYVNDLRSNENHMFTGREALRHKFGRTHHFNENCGSTNSKVIMHIDMDCFFVSVGIRDIPELKGVPVAVAHAKGNRSQPREGMKKELEIYKQKLGRKSDSEPSTSHWTNTLTPMDSLSEIASCSYEARAAGVKNGMFLGQALKLCPNLKSIHYDFEAYKEVSYTLYNTVARYTLNIEAVSCDEMYVDCTELLSTFEVSPLEFASILRKEIKTQTRCPCSVGFGGNRLQARIATKKAKPDGQYYLHSDVETFFQSILVSDLPGVGYTTSYKLKVMGVNTCGDLQEVPLNKLQSDFGQKLGEMLYKYCRGIDDKELVFHQVRKSVSAEVNYGIRFQCDTERDVFLEQLSNEVSGRIKSVRMKGKSITLKLMVRSKEAPEETAKFLGHGVCDHITKSSLLPSAVAEPGIIYREVLKIINKLNVDSRDLRGIGIQLTRLENSTVNEGGLLKFLNKSNNTSSDKKNTKLSPTDEFLSVPSTSKSEFPFHKTNGQNLAMATCSESLHDLNISQVDHSVLSAIPDDIRREIMSYLAVKSKTKKSYNESSPENEDMTTNDSSGTTDAVISSADEIKSYVSPGELKNLLREWIENEEKPMDRDISFVDSYLQELVVKGYLEELSVILKYFFRFIQRCYKSVCWKSAYSTILQNVQSKMKSVFKGELALDEQFIHF